MLVNSFSNASRLARARESGLNVFDLGDMRGTESLQRIIKQLATLLAVPERGEQLWRSWSRRLAAVAADIPRAKRRRAAYAGIYGGQIYGGAQGSSYFDVLTAAGLTDVATAAGYQGFPNYSREQLLTLDPPWLITQRGREGEFCNQPGLSRLHACQKQQVVGIDPGLLGDPGLQMLDAAEAIHDAVYAKP